MTADIAPTPPPNTPATRTWRDRWKPFAEIVGMILPFAEIAGIILLGIYTFYTVRMYYVNKQAADAATTAGTEARLSREQAVISFKATVDQFHLDQRAWIGLANPVIKSFEPFPVFEFGIVNSGKTPAINVKSRVDWKISPDRAMPSCRSFAKDVARFDAPSIPPHGRYILREPTKYPRILDDATHNYWEKGMSPNVGGPFCIFGEITYSDFTGAQHFTHFCVYARPNGVNDVGYCEEFNDLN